MKRSQSVRWWDRLLPLLVFFYCERKAAVVAAPPRVRGARDMWSSPSRYAEKAAPAVKGSPRRVQQYAEELGKEDNDKKKGKSEKSSKGMGMNKGFPYGEGYVIITPGENGTTVITYPDGTTVIQSEPVTALELSAPPKQAPHEYAWTAGAMDGKKGGSKGPVPKGKKPGRGDAKEEEGYVVINREDDGTTTITFPDGTTAIQGESAIASELGEDAPPGQPATPHEYAWTSGVDSTKKSGSKGSSRGKGPNKGYAFGDGYIVITPEDDGTTTITFPDGTSMTQQGDSAAASELAAPAKESAEGTGNALGTGRDTRPEKTPPSSKAMGMGMSKKYPTDKKQEDGYVVITPEENGTTTITYPDGTVVTPDGESENVDNTIDKDEDMRDDSDAPVGPAKTDSSPVGGLFSRAQSLFSETSEIDVLRPKIRQSAGFCQLNTNGFYGEPIGLVYEVSFAYQVTLREGTSQAMVESQIAPALDVAVAESSLPYLFDCSTRRGRHLQETFDPIVNGLSRLPVDFPIVNGGELAHGHVNCECSLLRQFI